jgi:hypothetical protein
VNNLCEGLSTGAFAQCIQPRVTADSWRKVRPVCFSQGAHKGIPALLANLAVVIPTSPIKPDITLFSVLWHG